VQLQKQLQPSDVTSVGILHLRHEHPSKQWSPIDVKEFGRLTSLSDTQSLKQPSLSDVRFFGIFIEPRSEHFSKQRPPIDLKELGRIISLSDVQP
jgi:hypothetical protein